MGANMNIAYNGRAGAAIADKSAGYETPRTAYRDRPCPIG
jgi:hypothetical protein